MSFFGLIDGFSLISSFERSSVEGAAIAAAARQVFAYQTLHQSTC